MPCPPTDHLSLYLGGRGHSGFTVWGGEGPRGQQLRRPAIAPRGADEDTAQNHQTRLRGRMERAQ